ncbi:hypothetical protein [Novosphingobium olei]|uniref:HTH DNA binding domain-containing protein n=1 Tax=Novosphingobium olei TaxID=2728851 RepID=A0A7Y0GCC8_9SPHN|nr:hypothetical protein [Novosphingobium olei]NML95919.1 hypothetical protein [Novosphingobium olei]
MSPPPLPLCALAWSPDLAGALAEASAAVARLDARICASSWAPAWRLRASWAGYAAALRLQAFAVDEIDSIAHACGLQLAGRPRLETAADPFAALAPWEARLAEPHGRHWREDLPFTFDPPQGWAEAPALVRALALLDTWVRSDKTIAPWLAFPIVLARMGLTARPLPCLVLGDPGQRFAIGPRPALLKRLLKQLRRVAEDGLVRLDRLEDHARRTAAAIARERRPGLLADLGRLTLTQPCLAARTLAPLLGLTISGVGKLLERATRLGVLVETSGRATWRSYLARDVALTLGLIAPSLGRPTILAPPSLALTPVLAAFDAEMAALNARLARLGVRSEGPNSEDIDLLTEN